MSLFSACGDSQDADPKIDDGLGESMFGEDKVKPASPEELALRRKKLDAMKVPKSTESPTESEKKDPETKRKLKLFERLRTPIKVQVTRLMHQQLTKLSADDVFEEILGNCLVVFRDAGQTPKGSPEGVVRKELKRILFEIEKNRPSWATASQELTEEQKRFIAMLATDYAREVVVAVVPELSTTRRHDENSLMPAATFEGVKVSAGYQKLGWKELNSFEFKKDVPLPDKIMKLKGKKVAMVGYMMAMGQYENIHNFLLVESNWSCCFGVVPELTQVIVVTIPKDKVGADLVTRPVIVEGVFDPGQEEEDGWVTSLYRLVAEHASEIE